MPNAVTFTIPTLPPSCNSLYQIVFRLKKVELTPAARRWKSDSKQYVTRFEIGPDSFLKIDLVFHHRFYAGNGNLRIFDASNLTKLVHDCICEKLGINDARVKAWSGDSVDSEKEFVEVTLKEITNEGKEANAN